MKAAAPASKLSIAGRQPRHCGGINEQVLHHLAGHGLLTRIPEALDAVLNRISAC